MKTCPNCGKSNYDTSGIKCLNCGHKEEIVYIYSPKIMDSNWHYNLKKNVYQRKKKNNKLFDI